MVHVYDLLLDTSVPTIYGCTLFAFLPSEPVDTKKVTVLCLDNMLLGVISIQGAYIDKVMRLRDGSNNRLLLGAGRGGLVGSQVIEDDFGLVVEKSDDRLSYELLITTPHIQHKRPT